MGKLNKKLIAGIIAIIMVLGVSTGGAYAYKDEWTSKINEAVALLATTVYGSQIDNELNEHNEGLKGDLKQFISKVTVDATNELKDHRDKEIERGKKNLDKKLKNDKTQAQKAIKDALKHEKDKQEAKTDAKVETEKQELDAIVDDALENISN